MDKSFFPEWLWTQLLCIDATLDLSLWETAPEPVSLVASGLELSQAALVSYKISIMYTYSSTYVRVTQIV